MAAPSAPGETSSTPLHGNVMFANVCSLPSYAPWRSLQDANGVVYSIVHQCVEQGVWDSRYWKYYGQKEVEQEKKIVKYQALSYDRAGFDMEPYSKETELSTEELIEIYNDHINLYPIMGRLNMMVVRVKIRYFSPLENKLTGYWTTMLVDSGASYSLIDRRLEQIFRSGWESMGLKRPINLVTGAPAEKGSAQEGRMISTDSSVCIPFSVELQPTMFWHSFAVMECTPGYGGILGKDWLAAYAITLDPHYYTLHWTLAGGERITVPSSILEMIKERDYIKEHPVGEGSVDLMANNHRKNLPFPPEVLKGNKRKKTKKKTSVDRQYKQDQAKLDRERIA